MVGSAGIDYCGRDEQKNTVSFVIPNGRVIWLVSAGPGTIIPRVPTPVARSFLPKCSFWQKEICSGFRTSADSTSRYFPRCRPSRFIAAVRLVVGTCDSPKVLSGMKEV